MLTCACAHVCMWLYWTKIENAFPTAGCHYKGIKAAALQWSPVSLFFLSCHSLWPLSRPDLISITPGAGLAFTPLQILFLPLSLSPTCSTHPQNGELPPTHQMPAWLALPLGSFQGRRPSQNWHHAVRNYPVTLSSGKGTTSYSPFQCLAPKM